MISIGDRVLGREKLGISGENDVMDLVLKLAGFQN